MKTLDRIKKVYLSNYDIIDVNKILATTVWTSYKITLEDKYSVYIRNVGNKKKILKK